MKKIITIFTLFILLVCQSNANDSSLTYGRYGGDVYPIDNDNIRMVSEVIDVYVEKEYVECRFVFENTSDTDQTVLMGFPGSHTGLGTSIYLGDEISDEISDFKTIINGKEIKVSKNKELIKLEEINRVEEAEKIWFTWEVTFKPKEVINIFNSYTANWDEFGDSFGKIGLYFGYIITTGKEWKGTIGETTVNFHLDGIREKYDFFTCNCPEYIEVQQNKFVYHRKDFEPEEDIEFRIGYYEYIEDLSGKTICINAGHQKKSNLELEEFSPLLKDKKAKVTSGAEGEEEINLRLAKRLKEIFEEKGATVIMTREESDVNISNKERALIGNKADLVLNIHCNSSTDPNASGMWFLIPSNKNLGNKEIYEPSKKLANCIKNSMNLEGWGRDINKKIFEREDLTGLNWSEVPSIFIECGFLTNEKDKRILKAIVDADEGIYMYVHILHDIAHGVSAYFYGFPNLLEYDEETDEYKVIYKELSEEKTAEIKSDSKDVIVTNKDIEESNLTEKVEEDKGISVLSIIILSLCPVVVIIICVVLFSTFNKMSRDKEE